MSKSPSVEVRDWIYTASLIASAVVGVLISTGVVTQLVGTSIDKLIGAVSVAAAGGPALAKLMLSRQRKDATLDFSGTPAEQAVQAINATVAQAGTATADLEAIRSALSVVNGAAGDAQGMIDGHGPGR